MRSRFLNLIRDDRLRRQILRYGFMTALSAAVTLGLPAILRELFLVDEEIAVAIGLFCAFVLNFVTIRKYVFGSSGPVRKELSKFVLASGIFRILEYGMFLVLHSVAGVHYTVATATVLVLSLAVKFVSYRLWIFRPAISE